MKKIINKIFNKQINFKIIWIIIVPIIILSVFGLILLRSTSYDSTLLYVTFYKQLTWLIIGCIIFMFIQLIRLKIFNEYAYHLYLLLLFALIVTYFMPSRGGAQRWILFGPFSMQPSEIGKIIIVFAIAKFLSDRKDNKKQLLTIIYTLIIALIPALLVFRQPDLGTAIIYITVIFPMLYWIGIRPYFLFLFIAPILSILSSYNVIAFSTWMFILIIILFFSQPKMQQAFLVFIFNICFGLISPILWNNLYFHQKKRILTLIDPFVDPTGSGYHIIQSVIAIGSGGIMGKGFNQGTQNHLKYLPVRDSDFIISVAGEEFGLIGITLILISFSFFIYWVIQYLSKFNNDFFSLLIVGLITILFVHLVVNMGMTVGIFPVTGLPAPFLSYGGTFLITCILIIGIINNAIKNHI